MYDEKGKDQEDHDWLDSLQYDDISVGLIVIKHLSLPSHVEIQRIYYWFVKDFVEIEI